jgi:hypothetical protein
MDFAPIGLRALTGKSGSTRVISMTFRDLPCWARGIYTPRVAEIGKATGFDYLQDRAETRRYFRRVEPRCGA